MTINTEMLRDRWSSLRGCGWGRFGQFPKNEVAVLSEADRIRLDAVANAALNNWVS